MGFLSFGHSRNIMEHLENLCQTLKKWIERFDFNVEHSFKGTWWPLDCLDDFARCWSILMVQGFVGCQSSSWFTKLLYDNVCSFRHVYVQGLSIMIFWLFYSYPWDSKKPPVEGSCVDLPPWKITAQTAAMILMAQAGCESLQTNLSPYLETSVGCLYVCSLKHNYTGPSISWMVTEWLDSYCSSPLNNQHSVVTQSWTIPNMKP